MRNQQYSPVQQKQEVISVIKEWASPVLIGIVSMLLWRDVTELRSDVKILLSQQSANEVRIQNMESDINMLKSMSFKNQADEEAAQKIFEIQSKTQIAKYLKRNP
jgi:hypothetical protein